MSDENENFQTNAINLLEDNEEDISGYAKIQGPDFCRLITKLSVYLGREGTISDTNPEEEHIIISSSNKISRKHLHLFWEKEIGCWCAKNLSKNHLYINKTRIRMADPPYILSPLSAIQIDDCKFYFFQAKEIDSPTQDNMIVDSCGVKLPLVESFLQDNSSMRDKVIDLIDTSEEVNEIILN